MWYWTDDGYVNLKYALHIRRRDSLDIEIKTIDGGKYLIQQDLKEERDYTFDCLIEKIRGSQDEVD